MGTSNKVWLVQISPGGVDIPLFHVYASTMEGAREAARGVAKELGYRYGEHFTVHHFRDNEIPFHLTLAENALTAKVPAIDV